MIVKFTKMHSLGNDFVMLDLITQHVRLHAADIKKIADRNLGIGCDQVISIEPPINKQSDFYYRNYNADGHEAEQCGNGARCAARFVIDSGLASKKQLKADCLAGSIGLLVKSRNYVSVNMGTPREIRLNKFLDIEGESYKVHAVSVGNPHIVTFVPDLKAVPMKKIGFRISDSNLFSSGANVSFVHVVDDKTINIRVYERGAGETLSCGSAACASGVISRKLGFVSNRIEVNFKHGKLDVNFLENNDNVYLAGPTSSVFSGHFRL